MVDRKPAASGQASTTPVTRRATSPYGTRSRNRGVGRVNYAEDKDDHMDFEPTSTTTSTSTATPVAAVTNGSSQTSSSSRRQSTAAAAASTKENPPNAPSTATSKKRKASQPVVYKVEDRGLSNMPYFNKPFLKDGKITSEDGLTLQVNDHIYLVCEPPGEPYYLARIMEFLHANNDPRQHIDSIKVNWYYRPKDIQRKVTDSRQLFATMHSDTCPLTSIRGKCRIMHKADIEDFEEYRKTENSFWYEKMFDRYIHRFYDVVPTRDVRNVPEKVRRVLCERWKYIIVEPARGKELTSELKACVKCSTYCASDDSVQCAVCGKTYHMNCVRPPLLKKPSRGFAWACGPCNREAERRLAQTRNDTPITTTEAEEELIEEEEDDHTVCPKSGQNGSTGSCTPMDVDMEVPEPTEEQLALARQWPYRYLGTHCKVEDVFDYDDRIYPRAVSRIGTRHQAVVLPWYGRPVEYVKPLEVKKRNHKKKDKTSAAAIAAYEAALAEREKRPKWVQDEPPGYTVRGEDNVTTEFLFTMPEVKEKETEEEREKRIEDYMERAKKLAPAIGIKPYAVDFLDKAIQLLYKYDYDEESALEELATMDKHKDLQVPNFSDEELKRFEEGVAMYGSELHSVTLHINKHKVTKKESEVVRFYYLWKKTPRGHQIWGNFEGRRHKKEAQKANKLADDVADDRDDSAFDGAKAAEKKRGFQCKFCNTRQSPFWRRAPGVQPGTTVAAKPEGKKGSNAQKDKTVLHVALCNRCGELWRKYALQYEEPEELLKKLNAGGGRARRRLLDEEYMKIIAAAQEAKENPLRSLTPNNAPSSNGTSTPVPSAPPTSTQEPPKKKQKMEAQTTKASAKENKEKDKEKKEDTPVAPTPKKEARRASTIKAIVPEPPKPPPVPCAVCLQTDPAGTQKLTCRECKLTVHRACYGVREIRGANKWLCDMCANDKNPQSSTSYTCVLCPVRDHEEEATETEEVKATPAPKSKKKSGAAESDGKGKDSQKATPEASGKIKEKKLPPRPRQPLKQTAGNNWVHIVCAVWTPEVQFGDSKTMKPVEGIGMIPQHKYQWVCQICKQKEGGSCITCHQCHNPVHVGCAHKAGYKLGFDIAPVKGSRRDQAKMVSIGAETGIMSPLVWCPTHAVKSIVHRMDEECEDNKTALELYVQTYKQADLSLTGTVRKASLISLQTKASHNSRNNMGTSTRASAQTSNNVSLAEATTVTHDYTENGKITVQAKKCANCETDVSPFWWDVQKHHQDLIPLLEKAKRLQANGVMVNGDGPNGKQKEACFFCHRCHTHAADELKEKLRTPTPPPASVQPIPPAPVLQAQLPLGHPPPVHPQQLEQLQHHPGAHIPIHHFPGSILSGPFVPGLIVPHSRAPSVSLANLVHPHVTASSPPVAPPPQTRLPITQPSLPPAILAAHVLNPGVRPPDAIVSPGKAGQPYSPFVARPEGEGEKGRRAQPPPANTTSEKFRFYEPPNAQGRMVATSAPSSAPAPLLDRPTVISPTAEIRHYIPPGQVSQRVEISVPPNGIPPPPVRIPVGADGPMIQRGLHPHIPVAPPPTSQPIAPTIAARYAQPGPAPNTAHLPQAPITTLPYDVTRQAEPHPLEARQQQQQPPASSAPPQPLATGTQSAQNTPKRGRRPSQPQNAASPLPAHGYVHPESPRSRPFAPPPTYPQAPQQVRPTVGPPATHSPKTQATTAPPLIASRPLSQEQSGRPIQPYGGPGWRQEPPLNQPPKNPPQTHNITQEEFEAAKRLREQVPTNQEWRNSSGRAPSPQRAPHAFRGPHSEEAARQANAHAQGPPSLQQHAWSPPREAPPPSHLARQGTPKSSAASPVVNRSQPQWNPASVQSPERPRSTHTLPGPTPSSISGPPPATAAIQPPPPHYQRRDSRSESLASQPPHRLAQPYSPAPPMRTPQPGWDYRDGPPPPVFGQGFNSNTPSQPPTNGISGPPRSRTGSVNGPPPQPQLLQQERAPLPPSLLQTQPPVEKKPSGASESPALANLLH